MRQLNLGSLFSGIGGFEIAAERCGMRVAWSCEIDPFGRKVLARHWPGTELYPDVRSIEPFRTERVDVITGGFPCQDLSVAGKRAGLAGERSGLFWEIVRIADALRPAWLVLENVPGLLSSEGGGDMDMVVGALRDLGYLGAWRVLDAQWFGVAQRRRRVFLVCCLGRDRLAALLPFLASGNGHPAPRRTAGQIAPVCPTLRAGANRTGGDRPPGTDVDTCESLAIPTLQASGAGTARTGNERTEAAMLVPVCGSISSKWAKGTGGPAGDECQNLIAHTLRGEGFDASEDGTGRGTPLVLAANETGQGWWNEGPVSGTLRAEGENRPSRPSNVVAYGMATSVTPKFAADLSPTLCKPSPSGGGQPASVAHGSQVRRLSPTECERLQGFSWRDESGEWQDGHTCLCGHNRGRSAGDEPCKCPDGPRYRALGNAVAVPVAEWILRRVLEAEAAA